MNVSREKIFALIVISLSMIVTIGVCELSLRLVLFSDGVPLPIARHAWRYADGTFEDEYWKLHHIFEGNQEMTESGLFDPLLGWAPEPEPDNPLRLVTDSSYDPSAFGDHPILFYGDSFVAGITAMDQRIPQIMNRLLPNRSVLNYGMSGYGLDQIYLRYKYSVEKFESPMVLIGVLTRDLDRSILSFRSRQKPYFELDNDELVLRNSPITRTTHEFLAEAPPDIGSYFGRFVLFRLRSVIPESWFNSLLGYDDVHDRKLAVNRAILQQFDANAGLHFIIFYSYEELKQSNWREHFLKTELDAIGIPYIDTKPLLLEHMSESGLNIFDDDLGHLNDYGNWLVAEYLAKWIRDRQDADPPDR